MEAEYAETEYGWIEPGLAVLETQGKPLCRVNRFWEKPALPKARALLQSGCLWNTFVAFGSAATFLELVCSEVPEVVLAVTRALAEDDLASSLRAVAERRLFTRHPGPSGEQTLGASRFRLGMGGPWQPQSRARPACQGRQSAGLGSSNRQIVVGGWDLNI